MLQTLDMRVSQSIDQQLAPLEFLALLLDDELERRQQQGQVMRLAKSGCDCNKTLAHFDFLATPGINRTLIQDLASCLFIQRHENLLMCGPTGVGKTHLANALGIEALKRDLRVISKPTFRLLADLNASRDNGSYNRHMTSILKCDLLVLDDFGLQVLPLAAIQDLYEIICERYERGSILVTSNRAFEEWAEVFNNDLLSPTASDRLTHHAHTLVIQGESYEQLSRRKETLLIAKSA